MVSKGILLLGLVAAIVLLMISSEVAARDLVAKTSATVSPNAEPATKTSGLIDDAKYGGWPGGGWGGWGGGWPGRGWGGWPGRGWSGVYPGQAMDAEIEANRHN